MQRFIVSVCEEAYKCGHCPVLWSTPGGHYDRDACQLTDRALQKKLFAIGGKPYQPQEQPPAEVRGDLNGDGTVTAADAVLLTKHLVGTAPLSDGRADLSGDTVINAVDLTLLKRILLTAGTK